ncbi:MAG: alpha/beta hydrolase [Lachnospiraceae bacterium]|nr:alpha/beta hydrolase [Lachnospiraceae bacterium]
MDYRQYLKEYWDAIDKANAADYPNGVDPEGYRCEKHIAYMGDYDPAHMLNLYYPEDFKSGNGSLPSIIYIHGGGWMYGSGDISDRYLGYLASRGFSVMAMNYRLLQQGDLKEMISDIFSAMQWLGKYGPVRGFDLSKVLVCGDSAGGHLSILTTCISRSEELRKIYGVDALPYEISAVSVSSPVAETGRLYIAGSEDTGLGQGTAKAYVDMMLGEKGEDAPWNGHMAASEVVPGPGLPPVHIIASESDVHAAHTGYLRDVLEKNGISYELFYRSKEEGIHLLHVFNISHWEWYESIEANESMLGFFRRVIAD